MKIDYAGLGREALERLRATKENAKQVQKRILFDLLERNKNTLYGKKYQFAEIKKIEEFQEKVPVSSYQNYGAYIKNVIEGEENVLTAEEPVYFCISSGTTGEAKYLPLTKTDLEIQYIYAYGIIYGMVMEYYRELPEEEIFAPIFQIGEFARTCMENGKMNGIRSGSLYQWLDREGGFDASDYCVPKEVLFPENLEDLLYVKVRFALARPGLRAIHGVFINRVAGVMDYIYQNWDVLLRDMEQGSVDEKIDLADKWKSYIIQKLPPDPDRARELKQLSFSNLRQGMIGKIWPKMKYVLAIGGGAFSYYTNKMKAYAGDIPIHYFAYAASEGIFGIARKINEPDAYILFPEAGFFEFIPLSGKEEAGELKPKLLWQLQKGEKYELLFTNHSGLYRYRMKDVIEVVDWYGKAPVVKFCYRLNQMINIAGEKSNLEQLEEAVKCFEQKTGTVVKGYCVQEDVSGMLPGYLFYMECRGEIGKRAEEILEDCLCSANYEYKCCRKMREIAPLQIAFLREGSFKRYEQRISEKGKVTGQNKLLHFLDTEEKKQFFASQRQAGKAWE